MCNATAPSPDDRDRAVSQTVASLLAGDPDALRARKALLQFWEEQPLAASIAESVERFAASRRHTIRRVKGKEKH